VHEAPAEPDAAAADESPFAMMDAETAANPQPMFKMLRDEMPVMAVDGVGVVLLRRAEIEECLRNTDVYTSNMSAVDLKNARPLIPLQIDPPEHKKYRRILDPLFAPKQMALLEEPVTALVNDLIDSFIADGKVDFAQSFSVPFPSQVFLALLGLPSDELPVFLAMKDGIIRPDHVTGTRYGSAAATAHQQATADSLYEYFDRVLDQREVEGRDDLLTRFLHTEVDGVQLTRHDILDICFLFLIAGLDTVTATLDCMFAFLAQHPEHRQQLVDDPTRIPAAIEEMLRWETPVMAVVRAATVDAELGGCPVKKGDQVSVLISSANCDEAETPDADVVRFDRDVNRHLAFGGGVHRCLGSHLARLELRVALREWHRRIPDYAVADDAVLVYTGGIRSIETFPMVFTAAG
jgi:cytochrome P450